MAQIYPCTFIDRIKTIPIVADSLAFTGSNYRSLKRKNELIGAFVNGVERSFTRATTACYQLSKNIVRYDCVCDFACEGLDMIEEKVPFIKKPTVEIWKECRIKALSTLSGVEDSDQAPSTIRKAVTIRTLSLISKASTKTSKTKYGKKLLVLSDNVLEKVNKAVNYLLPVPENLNEGETDNEKGTVFERTAQLLNKIKLGSLAAANRTPKSFRECATSTRCVTTRVQNKLTDLYNTSQDGSSNEGSIGKLIRLCTLISTGIALSVMGVIDSTLIAAIPQKDKAEQKENSEKSAEKAASRQKTSLESVLEDSGEEEHKRQSSSEIMAGATGEDTIY